jgi:hypothetical protein
VEATFVSTAFLSDWGAEEEMKTQLNEIRGKIGFQFFLGYAVADIFGTKH